MSSTYEDLREERQQATQAILEAGFFPSGMEMFPASDDTQWELIKRVIEECDYYVIIVAGRYGSIGPNGLSYTEMEYDYAVSIGVPVLGFVKDDIEKLPVSASERSEKGRKKLEDFRRKVLSRTCRKYGTAIELGLAVMKSLMSEARIRPRTGWVRADQARSPEDAQREREITADLQQALQLIASLERKLRDTVVLGDEIPRESLAQGDDAIELDIMYTDENKKLTHSPITLTWDEIFKLIAPRIYGYIVRRPNGQDQTYPFQDSIEEHIRTKLLPTIHNRKIRFNQSQIDAIIIQYKELGLLRFEETKDDDGNVFRGVTLTEEGERHLIRINTVRRNNRT